MKTDCPLCGHDSPGQDCCSFCGMSLPVHAPGVTRHMPTAPPDSRALPLGTSLQGGLYRLGRVLGEGGFGITYAGSDSCLHRLVAIKEFFPFGCLRLGARVTPSLDFPESLFLAVRERFLNEARVLARFQHPSIVRVYNFFQENDTAYMVMELVGGETLQARLERCGPLAEAEALGCIRVVGEALEAVHQAGYLHRDLKPENMMRTPDGRVVLLDFGTARQYAQQHDRRMTALVTPGYAPPEQYTGKGGGPQSDVYALAATLYHLLTGEVPVDAVERLGNRQVLIPPDQVRPSLSSHVARAILHGLEMEPAARPASIATFLSEIGTGPSQPPSLPLSPLPPLPPSPVPTATISTAGTVSAASVPTAPVPATGTPTILPPAPLAPPTVEELAPRQRHRIDEHLAWVRALAFSPQGDRLATGSEDRTVRLWDPLTGALLHTLEGHDGFVSGIAFSPDGRHLASASHDRSVRVWDVERGRTVRTMRGREGASCVSFAPDGRTVAAGFANGEVHLWNTFSTGQESVLCNGENSVLALAFSPDGTFLALGSSAEGAICLWDLLQSQKRQVLEGHQGSVKCLAWHRDGQILASGSTDTTLRLWDVQAGRTASTFTGHRGNVLSVAFWPLPDLVASTSQDKTVRLWQISEAQKLWSLQGHEGEVSAVAFSPDGRLMATGSQDMRVILWDLWPPSTR